MDVHDAIRTRKSVRAYKSKPVEEHKLMAVIEAARLAPSASNRQEWRFILVRNTALKKKLAESAGGQRFVGEAPVVIVACAVTDCHVMRCGQMCYPIDVAIAMDHIALAAVEQGLGTCWIGAFDEERVKEHMGIPGDVRVVELMTLGYPEDPSRVAKNRLQIEEIMFFERWGYKERM